MGTNRIEREREREREPSRALAFEPFNLAINAVGASAVAAFIKRGNTTKGNRVRWPLPSFLLQSVRLIQAAMPFLSDNGLRDTEEGGREGDQPTDWRSRSVCRPDIGLHTDLGRCTKNMSRKTHRVPGSRELKMFGCVEFRRAA